MFARCDILTRKNNSYR